MMAYDILNVFGPSHAGQIITGLILSLLYVGLYLNVLIYHEIGHKIRLQRYINRKITISYSKGKFYAGKDSDYRQLTSYQDYNVTLWGVILGFFPFLAIFPLFGFLPGAVLIVLYLYSCRQDFKVISHYVEARK